MADQILTLVVLAAVVAALIWDKVRADVVALSGAAVLLMTGVVRPVDVQGAFASPAIIALASLFVIAYALELSGLLDRAIAAAVAMCRRFGATGIWMLMTMIGSVSCFLNSTPIVVLGAPVIRDVATTLKLSPRRFLIPLSYVTILTGCCTLIGTSTNLLVDDMASVAGQARFGMFEITPVGLPMALVGMIYLFAISGRLLGGRLLAGAGGAAGELGHISVDRHGPRCSCGGRGCLELYLANLVDEYGGFDSLSSDAITAIATRTGEVLAAACNTVNPEVVVVGGNASLVAGCGGDATAAGSRCPSGIRATVLVGGGVSSAIREIVTVGSGAGVVGGETVSLVGVGSTISGCRA